MDRSVLAALALACIATAARAEDITIGATPFPVVTAQVNGKPARFEIDTTLPDIAVINPDAARRLGVHPLPVLAVRVALDDASIGGRVARPRVVFANGQATRSLAGLFGAPYRASEGVDGAIGPGVLPYTTIRFMLRAGGEAPRARTIMLANADKWDTIHPMGGVNATLKFNLARNETVLSRAMTRVLSNASRLTPAGDLAPTRYPLGLTTSAQPARTDDTIAGFALGPTLVRTDAPLLAPDGLDMVTVVARAGGRPRYDVTLGRAALAACSDIVWARKAKRLTLHCDS